MPIIKSLLDADFYKFTMGQLVFHRYANVPVEYAFINRTKKVHIPGFVDEGEIRAELNYVRTLRFAKSELHYLRGTNEYQDRMFKEDYLEFLAGLQLPEYNLEKTDGQYKLEFAGKWSEAIYWETIALSIVNELYYSHFMRKLSRFERDKVRAEGVRRLAEKIKILKRRPDITFTDFGTRRRFSREWQDYVVRTLNEELPPAQFRGTSNTYLAMKYSLLPMGTKAHEEEMALSGIFHGSDKEIRASHNKDLQDWWDEYGWGLSIALTDTFGTDFFFRDMTARQANEWKGLRQDSGDPFIFTDKAILFYERWGVDPKTKLIVYSDGLDVDLMARIADYRKGEIQKTFGWGTNLTNDLGFEALSLVVKLMKSNGNGTVKLSDNLAKALGKPEDVERFKRIFGYAGTYEKECKY
ncbi:MAG: nicotinate phosphoribosyltransferase [bacterium]|nr:nicotinate phosphoribosyltransferase [bacterium]